MLSGQGRLFLGDSERLCSLANASETGISVTFVYYALGNRFRRLMGTATRIQLGITAFIARYRHRSSLFETREAPVFAIWQYIASCKFLTLAAKRSRTDPTSFDPHDCDGIRNN